MRCSSVTCGVGIVIAGFRLINSCKTSPSDTTIIATAAVVAKAPSVAVVVTVVTSCVDVWVAAFVVGVVVIGSVVAGLGSSLGLVPLAKTTMQLWRVINKNGTIGILTTALVRTILGWMFLTAVEASHFEEFFEACFLIHFDKLFAFKDGVNWTPAEKTLILVLIAAAAVATNGRVERSVGLWSRGCLGTCATIAEGFGLFKDGLQQWIGGSHRLLF